MAITSSSADQVAVARDAVRRGRPLPVDPALLEEYERSWRLEPTTVAEVFDRIVYGDFPRWDELASRCSYCARPIRHHHRVYRADGELIYASTDEPDGVVDTRCGNRRASVCPSCSWQYRGDLWQVLFAGLAGGRKGVPNTVAAHPMLYVTLTAPSFGPVHIDRHRNGTAQPCRPRRQGELCPHGRPLWWMRTHQPRGPHLGEPLCPDCYDYVGQVLFNWSAPNCGAASPSPSTGPSPTG